MSSLLTSKIVALFISPFQIWLYVLLFVCFQLCARLVLICFVPNFVFTLVLLVLRGVAWSCGQHRRLPLQGSRVQISVVPSLFSKPNSDAVRCESSCMKTRCEKRTLKRGSGNGRQKNRQATSSIASPACWSVCKALAPKGLAPSLYTPKIINLFHRS